jgi:hypothetical protein
MRTPLAVIVVSALALTACSAHASTHKTAVSSPAILIARTAGQECARFTAADQAITSGTELDVTVGELAGSLNAEGPAWGKALDRAEKEPAGIPHGGNRANVVSADISGTAFALGMADLENDLGHVGSIRSDWKATLRGFSRATAACKAR